MDQPKCKTCKYFGALLTAASTIEQVCRRRPPEVFAQAVPAGHGQIGWVTSTAWPAASESDWCGDHQTALVLS